MLRSLLETISRGRVLTRKLSTPNGRRRMIVSPEASLRFWIPGSPNWDKPLLRAVDLLVPINASVWDIGSNVGVFSFYAAAKVGAGGRVLAVEADPFISSLLVRTTQSSPESDAQVTVLTAAVSDTIGTADLIVPNRSRASNHLSQSPGCSQTGGKRFSFKTVCVTLEWLLANTCAPDLVKMDIEGLEYCALRNSTELLGKVRPVFHLEVWNEISDDISKLLSSYDYEMFDFENDWKLTSPIPRATWCTFARPRDKARLGK